MQETTCNRITIKTHGQHLSVVGYNRYQPESPFPTQVLTSFRYTVQIGCAYHQDYTIGIWVYVGNSGPLAIFRYGGDRPGHSRSRRACGILKCMMDTHIVTDDTCCTRRTIRILRAGCITYQSAWDWQRELVRERSAGRGADTLLLLEHPPTITLGRKARQEHVLVSATELAQRGVTLVASDRGGDVTYHAPGQIVGYPILKLSRYGGDVGHYLRNLEEVIIRVLATYGLAGERVAGSTGVWVAVDSIADQPDRPGDNAAPTLAKIAAIGVHVSASGVTSHGFALNVAPDLHGFAQIIPCGLRDCTVTSLEQVLGSAPVLAEVQERLIACFGSVFDVLPV